jgi:hypothetical protein
VLEKHPSALLKRREIDSKESGARRLRKESGLGCTGYNSVSRSHFPARCCFMSPYPGRFCNQFGITCGSRDPRSACLSLSRLTPMMSSRLISCEAMQGRALSRRIPGVVLSVGSTRAYTRMPLVCDAGIGNCLVVLRI